MTNINTVGRFFSQHCRNLCLWLLVVAYGMGQNTYAQMNLPNHDKKNIHFGISLGFNNSQFALTHSDAFTYHDTILVAESPKSPGFNVGIISNLHLTKHLDFRFIPTLSFTEKDLMYVENFGGEANINTPKTVESILLASPFLLKYKSDRFFDNFRFYIIGGARFDWDFASNSQARRATDIIKLDRYEVLAEYGFGLEFYFPLFILSPEIKISQGLTNTHVPTPNLRYSDVLERLRSRYVMVSVQFEG
ncbi:MAG: outer membrane beta-barrel protein [Chitinophagales bacterium]